MAFVWNQHQPFYQDTVKNEYIMPWTRLHASKDYYQMAAILREYPLIHQTFNLTPSLLQQITDYPENGAIDYYMKVMKPVAELNQAEKRFLLQHYFDIQWDKVIGKYPRYKELLLLQGGHREPAFSVQAAEKFSTQDYRDLQVWFNLVWIDPALIDADDFLKGLLSKGRGFAEKEREAILKKQLDIMKEVIPVHRCLKEQGQIELMTTPYYHPIIPLIIDSSSALRAIPHLPLPGRYAYREDARAQIKLALNQYSRLFGGRPAGIWPPEQAVSPETVAVFSEAGFEWTISDEQILAKSLNIEIARDDYGHVLNPAELYQPYQVTGEGKEITMIFRDHVLSDRIGFEYQHFHSEDAASDIVHRLHTIREKLAEDPGNYLVTISLDGENAWEWYDDDKRSFLHSLYRRLSREQLLKCVTVSEYLQENPPRRNISHLFTGSWVDHNLARWIGSAQKNTIWDMLGKARRAVEDYDRLSDRDEEKVQRALNNIYIAEGSDYAWWVDSTADDLAAPFAALYRKHLAGVYHILGITPPAELWSGQSEGVSGGGGGEGVGKKDPLAGPVAMSPGSTGDDNQ